VFLLLYYKTFTLSDSALLFQTPLIFNQKVNFFCNSISRLHIENYKNLFKPVLARFNRRFNFFTFTLFEKFLNTSFERNDLQCEFLNSCVYENLNNAVFVSLEKIPFVTDQEGFLFVTEPFNLFLRS